MDVVNLRINEEDIKRYLKRNKDKYNGREALLLQYLKENDGILTKEIIEILLEKNYYQLLSLQKKGMSINLSDILPSFHPSSIQIERKLN